MQNFGALLTVILHHLTLNSLKDNVYQLLGTFSYNYIKEIQLLSAKSKNEEQKRCDKSGGAAASAAAAAAAAAVHLQKVLHLGRVGKNPPDTDTFDRNRIYTEY